MRFGVFDSGIGGVTVLGELVKRFPGHEFAYFGDTANVPYGTKSPEQILALARSAANRIRQRRIDALVVACNTASSLALSEMRAILAPVPVIGVVEAGVQAILEETASWHPRPPVLVFGTRATIRSGIYSRLLCEADPTLEVTGQECPLLVPLIEEGWTDHPVLHQTLAEYARDHVGGPPGTALLACTHYPWIRAAFERALPGWRFIDSAEAVARQLEREIAVPPAPPSLPRVEWNFSDPAAVAPFVFEAGGGGAPRVLVF